MPTVIDQFVIKVKLDTSEYEAGQKKLNKLSQQTRERAKADGNAFGDALAAGASKANGKLGILGSMLGKGGLIGVAVGSLIYAGKILDDKLFNIALGIRRIGIDSKNFGIAAANLRNLQNASEMAGGSLEDANKTVGGLAGSLYNLKFNGAVDDSLIALGRLGVRFQDSYGRARDFNAVMLDTADAIEKAKASGRMTDSEAFFFAGQAGFTGGMQNLVTSGRANVERELARQAARTQITAGTLKGSTDWVRSSTSLGQSVVAEGGIRGIDKLAEKRAAADLTLEESGKAAFEWLEEFSDSLAKATEKVNAFGTSVSSKLGAASGMKFSPESGIARPDTGPTSFVGSLVRDFSSWTGMKFSANSSDPNVTRARRNNNPFNIRAVGNQPRDDKGFRIFGSIDEGITAASHQLDLYGQRGNNTLGGIISTWAPPNENNTAEYIAQMSKATGMSATHVVTPEERSELLSAMAKKESGTNISVDEINIHTQATDAQGIARDINGALTRQKMLAAHAERGAQ